MTNIDHETCLTMLAIASQNKSAMDEHLDIYHDPKTRFHVRTWRGECNLTPLAFAVEIAIFDFASVVSVLVK